MNPFEKCYFCKSWNNANGDFGECENDRSEACLTNTQTSWDYRCDLHESHYAKIWKEAYKLWLKKKKKK